MTEERRDYGGWVIVYVLIAALLALMLVFIIGHRF